MHAQNKVMKMLALVQLIFGILIATVTLSSIGYIVYRDPLGQFIKPLSESVISVSKAVEMTAETIASKDLLIQSTKQTLVATSFAIQNFQNSFQNLSKNTPQLANEIRAASVITSRLGETLNSISNGLMFSTPTDIKFVGVKPVLIISRPLASYGDKLKLDAQNIQAISNGLRRISDSIDKESHGLSLSFDKQLEQTLILLKETAKTLEELQKHDLPDAVSEMREAAKNLRLVSKNVDDSGSKATLMLIIIGLLVSGWCLLNSLSQLMLVSLISRNACRE